MAPVLTRNRLVDMLQLKQVSPHPRLAKREAIRGVTVVPYDLLGPVARQRAEFRVFTRRRCDGG